MYLADTHVLLWWLSGTGRLSEDVKARLQTAGAAHYSAASMMEVTIKSMLGKVKVPADLASHLASGGWIEVPLRATHAVAMADFPALVRHDPFDRVLLAQAATEQLTFLTADHRLLALGHDWIVDATV